MIKTTLKIDGMKCPKCEEHVNNEIKERLIVKEVTSSHDAGTTEIISKEELDKEKIQEAVKSAGFTLLDISSESYSEKKGLFHFFHV